MFKRSQEETEINTLISRLLGKQNSGEPESEEVPSSFSQQQYYQLPVKHTQGGALIDEEHKPWIVGTFYPGKYLNKTHPGGHNGVDLKAEKGSPVYPIGPGVVTKAISNWKDQTGIHDCADYVQKEKEGDISNIPTAGNLVAIEHEDGKVRSLYLHMDEVRVSVGQNVGLSTVIGTVGETGNAMCRGAHLHYEVRVEGALVDPLKLEGKPIGSLSKKAEFIANIISHLEKLANTDQLEEIQKEFPSAKLADSRKSAEQFVVDVAPKLVYGHIIKCKSLKQCSNIAPLFAAVASRSGYATLVASVPGHVYNVMLTEEGPLGVDLTAMQFYMNRVAKKIIAEDDDNDYDIYGEERAAHKLLEELFKNPYKTVRVWPLAHASGSPSKNEDILGEERKIHYNEKHVEPDYASESNTSVINEPHPLGEIIQGSRKELLRKIAEDVGFDFNKD